MLNLVQAALLLMMKITNVINVMLNAPLALENRLLVVFLVMMVAS